MTCVKRKSYLIIYYNEKIIRKVTIFILAFCLFSGCTNETDVNKTKENNKQDSLRSQDFKKDANKFFAHRGLLNFAPENTLLALDLARERGFKNLELDIVTTKDNKIVVFHDINLKRMFEIDRDVCEVNYEELLTMKPSQYFFEVVLGLPIEKIIAIRSTDDPWVKKIDSQKISLIDDVFKTFGRDLTYHLDVKTLGCNERLYQELVSIIEKYALENNVFVESKNLELLEKIIASNPKIKTSYWNDNIFSLTDEEWEDLQKKGIDSVDLHYSNIDKNRALQMKSQIKSIKIHTFTVNSLKVIESLDGYVDYIITDLDILGNNADKYQFFNQKSQKIKLSSPLYLKFHSIFNFLQ